MHDIMTRARHLPIWMVIVGIGCLLGCSNDAAGPTLRKDVMWSLSVGPPAVSLAVNETYQLPVRPLDYNGQLIDQDVAVTYVSADTQIVVVDSSGLVRAIRKSDGQGRSIAINVRAGLVTKRANVWFGVTETAVDVDSLSLKPAVGEPVMYYGTFATVRARAFDSGGIEVPNVFSLVEFDAGQNTLFLFNPGAGMVIPQGFWSGWAHASVLVNGRLLTDSVKYRIGHRKNVDVTVSTDAGGKLITQLGYYTTNIYIAPNGQANFVNNSATPIDITFERPDDVKGSLAGASGGNIVALAPKGRTSRWFPAVGDYFFTVRSGSESKRISITVKE